MRCIINKLTKNITNIVTNINKLESDNIDYSQEKSEDQDEEESEEQ